MNNRWNVFLKKFRKKIVSLTLAVLLMGQMIIVAWPGSEVKALGDMITLGSIVYDSDGVGQLVNATGNGSEVFTSLTISFAQPVMNGKSEYISLPGDSYSRGYSLQDKASSSSLIQLKMPLGKTASEVASFIRDVKFYNCYIRPVGDPQVINVTLKADNNTEISGTAQAPRLSHVWKMSQWVNPNDATDNSTADIYCTTSDPKCGFYGADANHPNALQVALQIDDYYYNKKPCTPATIINIESFLKLKENDAGDYITKVSDIQIEYSKADVDSWSTTRPSDLGDYKARVTLTIYGHGTQTQDQSLTLTKNFSIVTSEPNYDTVDYGNLTDEIRENKVKVTGESSRDGELNSDLEITCFMPGISFKLYKLADITWNDDNKDYNDPVWAPQITDSTGWLPYMIVNKQKYGQLAYTTPLGVGNMTENLRLRFYEDMIKKENSSTHKNLFDPTITDINGQVIQPVTQDNPGDNTKPGWNVFSVEATETEAGSEVYKAEFHDLDFGLYAIVPDGDIGLAPERIQPTVVGVYPDRNGPWDAYFVNKTFYATFKILDANVEKTINDDAEHRTEDDDRLSDDGDWKSQKGDVVAAEEIVNFDVRVLVPLIYEKAYMNVYYDLPNDYDRTTFTKAQYDACLRVPPEGTEYTIEINDYLSSSLEFVDEGEPGLMDDVEVYLLDASGNEVSLVDYLTAYLLDPTKGNLTQDDLDALIAAYGPIYTITTEKATDAGFTEGAYDEDRYENTDTILRIKFNPIMLYELNTTERSTDPVTYTPSIMERWGSPYLYLRYQAKVTDNIQVGNEKNENEIYIDYIHNQKGEVGYKYSYARAYTYGIDIDKKEGNTLAPLAGAGFEIYRQVKPDSGSNPALYNGKPLSDYRNRSIYPDYVVVDKVDGVTEGGLFRQVKQAGRAGLDADDFICYGLNDKDELVTTKNKDGTKVTGLDAGTYIVREIYAPTGYNVMKEDMFFSIYALEPRVAELAYLGSFKYFSDYEVQTKQVTTPYETWDLRDDVDPISDYDGYFNLEVLNFKGITLPATGGIGTLIFIILGVAVIIGSFVGAGVKRKLTKEGYFR